MIEPERFGGALADAPDPGGAATLLSHALSGSTSESPLTLKAAGLDPAVVAALRTYANGMMVEEIDIACRLGAAWVLGRRSVEVHGRWELVATLPAEFSVAGVRRTTTETLSALIVESRRAIRLAAPFVDAAGLALLAQPLVSAAERGIKIEVWAIGRTPFASRTYQDFVASVGVGRMTVVAVADDSPWAHLKVLTVDRERAYVGSANLTGSSLGGRHVELGVVVDGDGVAVIDELLDQLR